MSRIIGLQIKLQNLQLTHALRGIFSFMWVFTLRPSLFLVGIVFQFWLLSITFDAFLHLILQFFFFSTASRVGNFFPFIVAANRREGGSTSSGLGSSDFLLHLMLFRFS